MTSEVNAERSLIGRMGANARWAKEPDRRGATQAARDGFRRKFEDQVDPERVLDPAERARRADSAMKAHMARVAMASRKARAAKKAARAVSRKSA